MINKPSVLLVGNGINLSYGGIKWKNLLSEISMREDLDIDKLKSPMPLQAILVTNNTISSILKNCSDTLKRMFYGGITDKKHRNLLESLLSLDVDCFITTNYSYELEIASKGAESINDYNLKKMSTHTEFVQRVENKYLLSSYNSAFFNCIEKKIWHIHGEARKPDSMILGHYYYSGLLTKMKSYLDNVGKSYKSKQANNEIIPVNSWLDAFILGDVYILGFGFDLSEFDLWWLLNRKEREKAEKGNVYLFEPSPNETDERLELLKIMGVTVFDCGFKLTGDKEKDNKVFSDFYPKAIEKISEMLKEKRRKYNE